MTDLKSKNAIITGASGGLGFAIAKSYVKAGINVLLCARNEKQLQAAKDELDAINGGDAFIKQADISNENETQSFCNYAFKIFKQVHILVNNAGIYGPMGLFENIDLADFKKCMDINFYGSVFMCRNLLPHFKQNQYGQIIQISGGGAAQGMPNIEGYAASKAAIVRFIESIAGAYKEYNISANCISPGLLNTRMLDQVLSAGENAVGKDFYDRMRSAKDGNKTASFEYAQKLCLFLASDKSKGITGKLISALWDKYEDWALHLDELNKSDVYTLRRITGKERNFSWGDK
ncbi:MAG: SDR family oxidoreductase [Elusimicrobiota bacterium]|jgi:NAD(P)-dependent dehydrogenase (short-subunit alcohol dehydrogenase family)|nr:SDR family oxidoreductase [Elusimicrobiota bacterium]